MVLSRALCVLLAVAGCNQSLFDAFGNRDGGPGGDGGGDGGGGDGLDVPETCLDPCIADAAADFNGSQGGNGNRWRYVEDKRDHFWPLMTATGSELIGTTDARNTIKACAANRSDPACVGLPDSLLISSADRAGGADPALEYRSPEARVIQLTVRAYVPVGSDPQIVRLYRNSREDVLFTASVSPDGRPGHSVIVPALAGDRFLAAVESTGSSGKAALHFFVSGTAVDFPGTCQIAVPFTPFGMNPFAVDNLCGGVFVSEDNNVPAPPAGNTPPPFPEHAPAAYLEPSFHYESSEPLVRGNNLTVQFWAQTGFGTSDNEGYVFSDADEDVPGGLAIRLIKGAPYRLEASTVINGNPLTYDRKSVAYAAIPTSWHFVRVVHAGQTITFCVDGRREGSFPFPAPAASTFEPHLGKNVQWDPITYYVGGLDDVRVFSEALPCN